MGWYNSGDEKNDERYEWEIENGLPNGQGTITFKVGGATYERKLKFGKRDGKGTITFPSRENYNKVFLLQCLWGGGGYCFILFPIIYFELKCGWLLQWS